MMRHGYESVNISRAATLTNLFYLFFHGGKSALIPFITIFFRLIGLTAFEAGGIIAAKTVTGLIWAPLWSRCAFAYNRQRVILMLSLFVMLVTNLIFPIIYTQLANKEQCQTVNGSVVNPVVSSKLHITTQTPATSSVHQTLLNTTATSSIATSSTTLAKTKENQTHPTVTQRPSTTSSTAHKTVQSTHRTLTPDEEFVQKNYKVAVDALSSIGLTPSKILGSNMTAHDLYKKILSKDPNLPITEHQVKKFLALMKDKEAASAQKSKVPSRAKRSSKWLDVDTFKSKLIAIQASLKMDRTLLCLVILSIVIAGEIFSSPVEKVADDSWFDFLNRIDDLERYGQQRFWGSLGFVLVPIIVTVAVDNTPCFLPFHLHHFLIHFYAFAILMAVALVIACCYPIPPPATSKHVSKIGKAFRAICCDGRGFMFSVTLLITGAVYASTHNFLFWRIQDIGGSESVMGLCVSAASFAEIPMLILSSQLVKRVGNCWAVAISLLVLSVRVVCYSVIPFPWAIVPIELSHGISHTALWLAILSYTDFNVGASVDRSIRSILSSFYFGIGFSTGSVIAGYVYHMHGAQNLYWGASALTGGWMVLFVIVTKCMPEKEKVRYIKLLRSESDNSDEEEDDWLEMALKEK